MQPAATAARVVVDDGMVLLGLCLRFGVGAWCFVVFLKDRAQDVGRRELLFDM